MFAIQYRDFSKWRNLYIIHPWLLQIQKTYLILKSHLTNRNHMMNKFSGMLVRVRSWPPQQLSISTIAPNAGILKTTRKRRKNIWIGRQPTRNMRVEFAPPLNGRRISQLDGSMEVDTTSITEVETSFRQAFTDRSKGSRSTEKKQPAYLQVAVTPSVYVLEIITTLLPQLVLEICFVH